LPESLAELASHTQSVSPELAPSAALGLVPLGRQLILVEVPDRAGPGFVGDPAARVGDARALLGELECGPSA
jgi:hypothetical protein